MSAEQHASLQDLVYADNDVRILFVSDKRYPFRVRPQLVSLPFTYIDLFALTFGYREQNDTYPCSRVVRDEILLLDKEKIINIFWKQGDCQHTECRYYSPVPKTHQNKCEIHCILARWRVLGELSIRNFTLHEIGKLYLLTRERVRQIQKQSLQRCRKKLQYFSFSHFS